MTSKPNRSNAEKGSSFEREVRELLELMGFSVRANELIEGTQLDLVAEKSGGLENLRLIVECTDRTELVGVALVKEKSSILLSLRATSHLVKLLLVSKSGFTAEAKAFARDNPAIDLRTLHDLESLVIDFAPYAKWYLSNFEQSRGIFAEGRLADRYVELDCDAGGTSEARPLSQATREWLADPGNNLLFILGEFGSGKTSFCRRFAYDLLDERFRRNQPQRYIPILINLRENRRSFDLPRLLVDTLTSRYGVKLNSFHAFEHFCTKRHICLLLDGLDEMVDRSDRRSIAQCLEQVFLLASLNAKTIVSCRSNFFNSNADIVSALKTFSVEIDVSELGDAIVELSYGKHGKIMHVSPLSQGQISEFIARRAEDPNEVLASIGRIHDLTDLSKRPVLLDMILTTLPQLKKREGNVNSAALYGHYTDRWKARDEWRVSMPLSARQAFCDSLAWVMHTRNIEEVGITELDTAMRQALAGSAKSTDDIERFQNDLKTCSFLTRTGATDRFRFAHKSFLEFFVACVLASKFVSEPTRPVIQGRDKPAKGKRSGMVVDIPRRNAILGGALGRSAFGGQSAQRFVVGNLDWHSLEHVFSLHFKSDHVQNLGGYLWQTERSALESQMAAALDVRRSQAIDSEVRLTEEIATFVVELLENAAVPIEQALERARSLEEEVLLADVLRLSRARDYVRRNAAVVNERLRSSENSVVKLSLAAALARSAEVVDIGLVQSLRAVLTEDGFSYVLFELASRRDQTAREAFKALLTQSDLRTLDRVLCRHGSDSSLAKDEVGIVSQELVAALLRSGGDEEFQLGLRLMDAVSWDSAGFGILREAMGRAKDRAAKLKLISEMTRCEGEGVWRGLRSLAAAERDKQVRDELSAAEQRVRDRFSAATRRQGWSAGAADSKLRESLWRVFRTT
jgi:Restriction endonuclease/NACHT domain